MPINPEDARPLNVQIATDLRDRIAEGEFPPGERFPSLRKLSTEYGVAEMTVHAAVRELQRDGLLVSVSGRGSYVRKEADVERNPEGASVLAELLEIKAELQQLRERVAAQDAAANTDDRLHELTRRVEALEHPPGGPDR